MQGDLSPQVVHMLGGGLCAECWWGVSRLLSLCGPAAVLECVSRGLLLGRLPLVPPAPAVCLGVCTVLLQPLTEMAHLMM